MEMEISNTGVTSVADISDNFPLLHKLTSREAIGIPLQMGVIKHQLLVGAELIDCCPAALALEEFDNLAVGSSDDRSSCWGRNIDGVMDAAFRTRIRERVQQLIWPYANHWNDQFQSADKTTRESRVFRGGLIVLQPRRRTLGIQGPRGFRWGRDCVAYG